MLAYFEQCASKAGSLGEQDRASPISSRVESGEYLSKFGEHAKYLYIAIRGTSALLSGINAQYVGVRDLSI